MDHFSHTLIKLDKMREILKNYRYMLKIAKTQWNPKSLLFLRGYSRRASLGISWSEMLCIYDIEKLQVTRTGSKHGGSPVITGFCIDFISKNGAEKRPSGIACRAARL